MPSQWSPGLWKYLNGFIRAEPSPDAMIIAVVHGRTLEEADANGHLMAVAPEAARLLAAVYPYAPMPLREQIHTWFSMVGVRLEDFQSSEPPPGET